MNTHAATIDNTRNSLLLSAVEDASEEYAEKNPRSRALADQAQKFMPGGNTRSALYFDPFPLYVVESFDARIKDADGHVYLDALGEFTAGLYGHSNPLIQKAVAEVAGRGVSNGAPGEAEIQLAELICGRFPSIKTVRFCNSGTEANLYALTLARAFTGRSKFLAFSGAYHGGVFVFGGGGEKVNVPFDWTIAHYNDASAVARIISEMGADLAAVIVEPMMSNGGCIPATSEFLRTLRKSCDEVGAVLIFDEVVTSRMGRGGVQQLYGIHADLTTLGKYIGGGFSFGGFGGKASIMALMDPTKAGALPHAGTFNNNLYTMSAGVVGLSDVFTADRADELLASGDALRARLNELARSCSRGVQFTGWGSAMNIHFVPGIIMAPEDLDNEPKDFFKLFHFDLMRDGVYAARRGQLNLSLAMTADDFALLEHVVAKFFERRRPLIRAICGDPNHPRPK